MDTDKAATGQALPPTLTFHLTPRPCWDAGDPAAPYVPETFEQDGFIHCTDGAERVIDVGNRYCREDPRPFVALLIDISRLSAEVWYEDPERVYPHIYGPLNRDAIVAVIPVKRDYAGGFIRLADRTPPNAAQ